jgi:hypothetical protein
MRVVNEEGADLDCCGGEGVPSDVGGRSKPSEGGTDGKAKEERLAEVAQERRARPPDGHWMRIWGEGGGL